MNSSTTATVPLREGRAPPQRISLWRTPRTRALLVLGTLGGTVALLALAARIYVDLLWFRELGHESVFWTTLEWRVMAEGLVALGTGSVLLANFAVVEWAMSRRAGAASVRAPIRPLWRLRRLLYPLVAIGGAVVTSVRWPDVSWQHLLLWAHRSEFGVEDPLFHRDVGFFVFSLPVYRELGTWLLETLVIAGVTAVVAYTVAGGLGIVRLRVVARAARAHLLVLGALLLLALAWRFRLEQFALAVPHEGAALPGASYTDVHVRLPALRILTGLSLVGAVLLAYGAARRVPVRALAVVAVLGAVTLVGMDRLPSLMERFNVQPQELSRERPYLLSAIEATRRAYELDRVRVRPLGGDGTLLPGAVAGSRNTISNVPLWDPSVLRSSMNELESIGSYYSFGKPTVDRYTIDGVRRLVTVAARQLDLVRLDPKARSWANERFAYTHGYGVVAIRAADADAERFPDFQPGEFTSLPNPLRVREPRTYYRERPASDPPFLIVPSKRAEVEEPAPGSRAPEYHYDGSGGIPLSNRLRVAAFAARFGDLKLLLSRTVTDSSRILLHRDVRDRVRTLVPFLQWEAEPQLTVIDGRVVYLFHGYTTSNDYPYSARTRLGGNEVNYVREGARATVDAFSGRVNVYAADSTDPILRAWKEAYPDLFLPASELPKELRAHLRYPAELFAAQMKVYATYHAGDPTAFWTGADVWERPLQLAGPVEEAGEIHFPDPEESVDPDEREEGGVNGERWTMRPEYLYVRLPGDRSERFILATPFTPRGRHNLVSYLAGSIDPRGRPRLTLLSLPRKQLTLGPAQATRRILASPAVNRRLELLNKESRDLGKSAVVRTVLGDPRVVPIGRQLVHVQPIYLTAGGDGVPRLQLVTVHVNGRVGYGPDLRSALRRVLVSAKPSSASAAAVAQTP